MNGSSVEVLCAVLSAERALLARLLQHLDQPGECDRLFRSLSCLELQRAIAARAVVVALGVEGDTSLNDIIAAVPDRGWRAELEDHRTALVAGTEELRHRRAVAPAGARSVGADESLPQPHPVRVDARPMVQRSLREFLA